MTQNGQAEVGDQVFFFASVLDDPGHAGQVLAAQVVKRPTTANILYLLILDQDATPFQNSNIAQASSLEQCLEIGHCWASKEQLISWGVELHNGDQDLTAIGNPL